jgi:hypothetical protein
MKFEYLRKLFISILIPIVVICAAGTIASAQRVTIRAIARGTSTQLGKLINVDIHINQFSDASEQSALLEAFQTDRAEGLANALDKLPAKGRMAITGTVGFDLNYIRLFKMPDGSQMIRFVTDRPIRMGEAWGSTRSMDYNITMGEIHIPKDKKKLTGTLLPAVRPKLDKKGEIELENYQNPWELSNMKVYQKGSN